MRRFNRAHTKLVGALNEHLLKSPLPLPQARLVWELAQLGWQPPSRLAADLALDPGYLSRLLKDLEAKGLVARAPSPDDGRQLLVALTDAGRSLVEDLDRRSVAEVEELLGRLGDGQQSELVGAMERILQLLGPPSTPSAYVLRDPYPGDLSLVASRQMHLYAREYGWDWTFEALLCDILAQFVRDFDPKKERCWIAEQEGRVAGSVFVVRQDESAAKLRMLYVEPEARGQGIGRRLVDEAIRFARQCGYRRMTLWTNDILHAARRIYEAAGFCLVEEEPHHSFGRDLVGQYWTRDL
ncbi:bifunctional helix-turn-helix transcriptional regulator/GNAT family N-acetyltransferase [Consotaella aegiceratis]|uniref:bifunctional helix-turn-helix transcriptional regulator/GNAT family N-acetyltransferase n=1 Tax=Consotaella aegiceratis TaxID=3097961 RepID=UPI002F402394